MRHFIRDENGGLVNMAYVTDVKTIEDSKPGDGNRFRVTCIMSTVHHIDKEPNHEYPVYEQRVLFRSSDEVLVNKVSDAIAGALVSLDFAVFNHLTQIKEKRE